jgi:nitrogen fixation protein FixH
MGRAFADLIRGIDQLLEIAKEDQTVANLREAPKEIQDRAAHSKPLPNEIFEVAHKLARGQWPQDIDPAFTAQNDDETFRAELCETV